MHISFALSGRYSVVFLQPRFIHNVRVLHFVSHHFYPLFHILQTRGFYLHKTRNAGIFVDIENDLAQAVRGSVFLGNAFFDAAKREEDICHVIVGFELRFVLVSTQRIAVGKLGFGRDDALAIDFSEADFLSFGIPEKFRVDVGVEDFFSAELFEGSDDFGFVDFKDFDFDF